MDRMESTVKGVIVADAAVSGPFGHTFGTEKEE